jgi:16S rRNA G966 N2-methylase RsmD
MDPAAISVIRRNIAALSLDGRVRIIRGDALRVVKSLEAWEEPYRIALVAPPYFRGLDGQAMDLLGASTLVEPAGIVILQQHKKEPFQESYGRLRLRKTYLYGETRVSTYLVEPE